MAQDKVQELETLIRAKYPILYILSAEERRVEEILRAVASARRKKLFGWTATEGIQDLSLPKPTVVDGEAHEPLQVLNHIAGSKEAAIFVLKDFHSYVDDSRPPLDPERALLIRRLRDVANELKESRKTLVLLSPIHRVPVELEKDITLLDYSQPTATELHGALERVLRSARQRSSLQGLDLDEEARARVVRAAQGLTCTEAENAFAKSLVMTHSLDLDVIIAEKRHLLNKSRALEFFHAPEDFREVGGLGELKEWLRKRGAAFSEAARRFGLPEPRGLLLLGVQGGGKSLMAKAVASQWKLPLLRLDMGRVFGEMVGASEQNMRHALRVAESVAPCLTGDTLVTLADGSERSLESLYEEPPTALFVLGMTENLQLQPVLVQAVTRRPAPDLYHIQLMHGSLRATSNHLHPVMRDGSLIWVQTNQLQRGDQVAMPLQIPTQRVLPRLTEFLPGDTRLYFEGALAMAKPEYQTRERRYAARARNADFVKINEMSSVQSCPDLSQVTKLARGHGGTGDSVLPRLPDVLNEDIGYLLGLIASDGFLGKTSCVGFVNTNIELHDRFAGLIESNFGLVCSRRLMKKAEGKSKLIGTSDKTVYKPCYTTFVNNRLLNLILSNVQNSLLKLPISLICVWLRGYCDGDGFVSSDESTDPKITLTAKITSVNHIVRAALHRVGIPTTNSTSQGIEITGFDRVHRFISVVGSHHAEKIARMEGWVSKDLPSASKDRTDTIPVGQRLRRARRALGMGMQHFNHTSSSLISYYERGVIHPNRSRLRSIILELKAWAEARHANLFEVEMLQALVDAEVGWSRVLNVQPDQPPQYVYDLVCDAPHTFVANGFVTHNCVLWLDEVEKGMAGAASSGRSDAGTAARVFGTFLTWMQEKQAPVFVVATSNDVRQLPPELLRKGRFDEIFFVDLPTDEERAEIWAIHLRKRGRDPQAFDLRRLVGESRGFSGAEIEQVVIAALYDAFDERRDLELHDLIRVLSQTVPLSETMRDEIAALRAWAREHARAANSGGPAPWELVA